MKLEEAREIVQNMRNRGRALNKEGDILSEIAIALIILDDRITELEAELSELNKRYENLNGAYRENQRWAIKLQGALAQETADKLELEIALKTINQEDKGNDNTTDIRRKPDRIDYGTGG